MSSIYTPFIHHHQTYRKEIDVIQNLVLRVELVVNFLALVNPSVVAEN